MATVTIESANDSSWAYEDITLNGVNYGDSLPMTLDLDTKTYHLTWVTTVFGLDNSGSITVSEDGQTFVLDNGEVYKK